MKKIILMLLFTSLSVFSQVEIEKVGDVQKLNKGDAFILLGPEDPIDYLKWLDKINNALSKLETRWAREEKDSKK